MLESGLLRNLQYFPVSKAIKVSYSRRKLLTTPFPLLSIKYSILRANLSSYPTRSSWRKV